MGYHHGNAVFVDGRARSIMLKCDVPYKDVAMTYIKTKQK